MEWYSLQVFRAVATERSFSRAAEKLYRTQPAVSLAVQRLEAELGERLIDRAGKEALLTDAGRLVLDYARRFDNLRTEMDTALAELRDNAAGRLVIGANESTTVYLLSHLTAYRRLYPHVRIQVRRSLSSQLPSQIVEGDLELGAISYAPQDPRVASRVIFTDHLAFIVSPRHRFASRRSVSIRDLEMENFIAHNVASPYRNTVLRAFEQYKVPLTMDVEMPTVETVRKLVMANEGVAFLPRMCVGPEIDRRALCEVEVRELKVARKIRLIYPARRALSRAARAFLDLIKGEKKEPAVTPAASSPSSAGPRTTPARRGRGRGPARSA
jgi:DNA-binding transcriptional LysR family regulator